MTLSISKHLNTAKICIDLVGKTALTTVTTCGFLLLTSCASTPVQPVQKPAIQVKKEPVVALVLGGGGAKGFAHAGVIKALETNNIKPDIIVGTSVGSLIGSLYASGMSASQLERLALTTKPNELTDFTLSFQGIIEGVKLRKFVNMHVNNQPIQSFPIRFGAVAADKHSLKKTVFTKGDAGLAVQASSSIPNIFIAPRIPEKTGTKYVDGGTVSIVPVDAANALGADVTIAVDLQVSMNSAHSSIPSHQDDLFSLIEKGYAQFNNTYLKSSTPQKSHSYAQDYATTNKAEIDRANVLIRPYALAPNMSVLDTTRRAEAIQAGFKATEKSLPAIRVAIKKAQEKP